MRKIKLGKSNLEVPAIALGCMRIDGAEKETAEAFVKTALEHGANFFDHADIYGKGRCESNFADITGMNSTVREKMILQSKCGIMPGMYNFSKEHILESADGILSRLKTDYLDVLLLHRPDPLMEPDEVAEAFSKLYKSGKVRNFGVSNQDPYTIQLLEKYIEQPIIVNQLQLSITNATLITQSMNLNMLDDTSINRDNGILNFCRLNDITIQAWSPFQYGFFEGVFLGNDKFPVLNDKINEISQKYEVTNTTIALAWILRHPAKIQPVTGTMSPERLKDCIKATEITLTREEWYEIYKAAGHRLP